MHRLGVSNPRASSGGLRVGGMVPLSTVDFPGKLAAVLFCQGCPWRCGYCHNPHLRAPRAAHVVRWRELRPWLERRQGLLDAVVFSGGEPTAQSSLPEAVREARGMGFRVGLHTAGTYPKRLKPLLPYLDWVGFDAKTAFCFYEEVTGARHSGLAAARSLRALMSSGVPCEVRTTVHPALVPSERLLQLASVLARFGVRRYVLQAFRARGCPDERLRQTAPAGFEPALVDAIRPMFETFEVRAA